MNIRKNYIILCFIYLLIFFSNALFLSFFQIFLLSKGFNESKIGVISAITPFLCIIANPLYSLIGNSNKKVRYLLMVLCLLEAIVILLVFKVNYFSLLILVMCLVAMVDPPLFVILDSYTSSFVNEYHKNYSYIRMIGTLAYAVGTFLAGIMIEESGYDLVFYLASLLMLISMMFVIFLRNNLKENKREKGEILSLIKNKSFIIFAIYFIFIFAFQALGDTYISVYLTTQKGLSESKFGLISASWVLIELIVILILNKINIKNIKILLIIMGGCYLLRLLMMGLDAPKNLVIISALLRGISMAISIYLYIPLLGKIVKPSNMSLALLLIAMFKSVISTVLISLTGFLINNNGYEFIFMIWSILFFIVILGYYFIKEKHEKIKN